MNYIQNEESLILSSFFQFLTLLLSFLDPTTVVILNTEVFRILTGKESKVLFALNCVLPLVYLAICLIFKDNIQVSCAKSSIQVRRNYNFIFVIIFCNFVISGILTVITDKDGETDDNTLERNTGFFPCDGNLFGLYGSP